MKRKGPFRYTGKRKNPATYVDVHFQSDRFDFRIDRYLVIVWAGDIMQPWTCFCYALEGFP